MIKLRLLAVVHITLGPPYICGVCLSTRFESLNKLMPRFEQLPGDATVPHRYVKIQVRLPILSLSLSFCLVHFLIVIVCCFLTSNYSSLVDKWPTCITQTSLNTYTIAGTFQINSGLLSFLFCFLYSRWIPRPWQQEDHNAFSVILVSM